MSEKFTPLVASALEVIKEEYPYLDGIDSLAQRFSVSSAHLVREFSRQVGISPGKYLSMVRLREARAYLLTGEYSVETVAQLCGYSCGNYFCKVFRKSVGISPKAYMLQNISRKSPDAPSADKTPFV